MKRIFKLMFMAVLLFSSLFNFSGTNRGDSTIETNNREVVLNNDNDIKKSVTSLSGTGTQADPYLINNLEDFYYFVEDTNKDTNPNQYIGKYISLTADLSFDKESYSDFLPIAFKSTYPFKGYFNGNGHTITVDYTWEFYNDFTTYGLFGNVTNAKIMSLNVNSKFTVNIKDGNTADIALDLGGVCGRAISSSFYYVNVNAELSIQNNIGESTTSDLSSITVGGLCGNVAIASNAIVSLLNVTCVSKFNIFDVVSRPVVTRNHNIKRVSPPLKTVASKYLYLGGLFGYCSFDNSAQLMIQMLNIDINSIKVGTSYDNFLVNYLFIGGLISNLSVVEGTDLKTFAVMYASLNIGEINVYAKANTMEGTYKRQISVGFFIGNVSSSFLTIIANSCFISASDTNVYGEEFEIVSLSTFIGRVSLAINNALNISVTNSFVLFNNILHTNTASTDGHTKIRFGYILGMCSSANATIKFINSYICELSGNIKYDGTGWASTSSLVIGQLEDGAPANDFLTLTNAYLYSTIDSSVVINIISAIKTLINASQNVYLNVQYATNLVDFTSSNLTDLNGFVNENADYFSWTLDKKNVNKYPVFIINVTFSYSVVAIPDLVVSFPVLNPNFTEEDITPEGYTIVKFYDYSEQEITFAEIYSCNFSTYYYAELEALPVDPEPEPEEPVVPTIPYGEEFDIIYNTKAGVINDANYPKTYICGVGVKLPSNVTKENYDFTGWSTRNLSGVIITSISNRQYGDVYLNANYSLASDANKFSITYETNDGTIEGSYVTSYLDEEVTLPTNVKLDHATFDGWYESKDFTGNRVYKISSTDSGDKTYYAKYVYEVYSIIYYLGNGTINELHVKEYRYGEEIILPTDVTSPDGKFIGFSETEGDKNNLVTKVSKTDYGTKVFYAIYEENNYTWLYWLAGGLVVVALGITITIIAVKHKKKSV